MSDLTLPENKLKKWKQLSGAVSGDKTNFIKLDNKEMIKVDGKRTENPNFGKLFATHFENGEEVTEEIPLDTEMFLIRVRTQIRGKYDDEGKAEVWCREVDRPDDWLELFNSDNEKIAEGLYRDLKEKYGLKYSDAAYVYYNDRIYRWVITGAHFDSWFPLKNQALERPYTIKVVDKELKEVGGGTVVFYSLKFELGEAFDIDKAIAIAETLEGSLKRYYEQIKNDEAKMLEEAPEDKPMPDDLPF